MAQKWQRNGERIVMGDGDGCSEFHIVTETPKEQDIANS